jgi:hypothetical protein
MTCGVFVAATTTTAFAQRDKDQPAPVEGRQFGAKAGEIVNNALQLMTAEQNAQALTEYFVDRGVDAWLKEGAVAP